MINLLSRLVRGAKKPLSYEETKQVLESGGQKVRKDIAGREDVQPEVLYYLAADSSSDVRRKIAVNQSTPAQADLVLARDANEDVRLDLAAKLSRLVPDLSSREREKTRKFVIEALEALARDQAVRVRQVLAEALCDMAEAPPSVIQRLARDLEQVVSCPVLELSPLLSDQDLIDIIGEGCVSGRLQAISRRDGLGEAVADAIVASDDRPAIAALLANGSAQIREQTLDALVEGAREVEAWQPPLVERPKLTPRMAQKLAGFVAEHLLDKLQRRNDLDRDTAERIAKEVRRRLDGGASDGRIADPASEVRRLVAAGELDEDIVLAALQRGDRGLVRECLIRLGGLDGETIDKVLSGKSAKGVTALAWKAGLSMRFATQLQQHMAGIPPAQVLNARDGTDFPMTPEEMTWQLGIFQSLSG